MNGWSLEGLGHRHRIELPLGSPVVIGRAAGADVIVPDATVSRRHAELTATESGVAIVDLKSSNGTAVNGGRIERALARPGDTIRFGKVSYRLTNGAETAPPGEPTPEGTVVRAIELGAAALALADAPALQANRQAHQLARLVDLARRLSGEFELDKLIAAVVELTFDLLPVDRVSLLLTDPASDELVPALSRSRVGDPAATRVPRSILSRAMTDRTPVITENAAADERFRSGSVMLQSVRGAICVPLLVSRDRTVGALYVDTLTADRGFSEEEATLLFAFGGLAAVSIGKLRYAEEVERQGRVRTNFERFFAPEVAARIARQSGAIAQGGDRRRVTVLFSDIRAFTRMAETMPPDRLGALLTEYFTEMADLVFEHGGTLDKFIGDAVMAVWGAPIAAADDADRAVAAALAMQRRVEVLNRRWAEAGRPTLGIGIGLNHGEVFAGYLGSQRRLEYSVIGDTVNVASRLGDAAQAGDVLLTDSVRLALRAPVPIEPVSRLDLKGKQQPVGVWRVRREG